MSRLALLLALVLAPGHMAAQAPALAGEWTVTLATGIRNENGVETPIMQTGTLSITAQGDSLIGIMKMQPPEGAPARPPARMAAKLAAGPAVFVLTSQATINMNGETSTRTAVSTFTLSANGDTLTGTLVRRIEGMDFPASPMPVTGSRVRK